MQLIGNRCLNMDHLHLLDANRMKIFHIRRSLDYIPPYLLKNIYVDLQTRADVHLELNILKEIAVIVNDMDIGLLMIELTPSGILTVVMNNPLGDTHENLLQGMIPVLILILGLLILR